MRNLCKSSWNHFPKTGMSCWFPILPWNKILWESSKILHALLMNLFLSEYTKLLQIFGEHQIFFRLCKMQWYLKSLMALEDNLVFRMADDSNDMMWPLPVFIFTSHSSSHSPCVRHTGSSHLLNRTGENFLPDTLQELLLGPSSFSHSFVWPVAKCS